MSGEKRTRNLMQNFNRARPVAFGPCVLLLVCMICGTSSHANVFGDGDERNGTEDDRKNILQLHEYSENVPGWPRSAGTISCEGKNRGSAVLIRPPGEPAEGWAAGSFIMTAAHVLSELDTGRAWTGCEFRFLGMSGLEGFRSAIDPRWVRSGPYRSDADRNQSAFGQHDWAFAWLGFSPPPGRRLNALPLMSADELLAYHEPHLSIELLAWNSVKGEMAISRPCQWQMSQARDLGGGAWNGQLLDSCDSGDGASGGGLVARLGQQHFLVAVRSGSHFDADHYPTGPADGAPWNVYLNTNFARAVDEAMLAALSALVAEVKLAHSVSAP